MMSRVSRVLRETNTELNTPISKRNFIRNVAERSQIGLMVGHGIDYAKLKPFVVPDNVHVVFLSDPGYSLSATIVDTNFIRMVNDIRIFRSFIRGTLPPDQVPTQLKYRNWKWWEHMYQPRAKCPNLGIEVYDRNHAWMDSLMGLWYSGPTGTTLRSVPGSNQTGRKLHGKKLNLSAVCRVVSKDTRNANGCILFVTSCRIPEEQVPMVRQNIVYPEAGIGLGTAYTRNTMGLQRFPLPASRLINRARTLEETATRVATRKRKMSGTSSRNTRPRLASNTTNNNNNINQRIQRVRSRRNTLHNMIHKISNEPMNVATARARFPNFFRNMSDNWSNSVIRNLKRNETVRNSVSEILNHNAPEDIMLYRINHPRVANRIIARFRNMTAGSVRKGTR
jgi:hypothetical protein